MHSISERQLFWRTRCEALFSMSVSAAATVAPHFAAYESASFTASVASPVPRADGTNPYPDARRLQRCGVPGPESWVRERLDCRGDHMSVLSLRPSQNATGGQSTNRSSPGPLKTCSLRRSANIVRELREAAGLSQYELGERAGVAQPNIAAYEAGRRRPAVERCPLDRDQARSHPAD